MAFYDLDKDARLKLMKQIQDKIQDDFELSSTKQIITYFSDEDTYIRKAAYLAVGRIYVLNKHLRKKIIQTLTLLLEDENAKVRQTVVNAAGEIGMIDFETVEHFFDIGLFDSHHSVRNAVIGSVKKMGEKNPKPVLTWANRYLHHEDKEIRREICHGIELRGRKNPQDILPLLKELQHDKTARVYKTLVHVLGQIAYKKGCLEIVLKELKSWKNKKLVQDALVEIIDVHERYKNFAFYSQERAVEIVEDFGFVVNF